MSDPEEECDEDAVESDKDDRGRQMNLERCLSCRHAADKDSEKGTLRCKKHSMLVNAPDDEIPDDCKEYEK
ncbi:MAG: hypothetical protein GXP25_13945 [Planctomycetes bacterium]|nr:hypothetical protein [Planctomycetota bacterium]